jgi:hypothetical protein
MKEFQIEFKEKILLTHVREADDACIQRTLKITKQIKARPHL